MASEIQQTPFVKQLAASDRPTREAALSSLRTYLSGRRILTPLDLLKLWKGLFYCMWMCDRPIPQQQLAASLASLPTILPASNVIPFLRAFWQTMAREWTNIDVLRMEKFLLLTRRYLGATFALMRDSGSGWEEDYIQEHLALLEEVPLNIDDVRLPNGMRYHVIDIYVDELMRAVAWEGGIASEKLLEPLKKLGENSPAKPVRTKCKEALSDERLPRNAKDIESKEISKDLDDFQGFEDD